MVFSGHEKNYVAIVSTLAMPTGTDLALDRPILSGVYDGFQGSGRQSGFGMFAEEMAEQPFGLTEWVPAHHELRTSRGRC